MTAIVYHQIKPGVDCPDGIAAAWVAKRRYPEADLIGCHYGAEPNFEGYTRVVIVDFSFPLSTLQAMTGKGIEVMVIDHHKTAMADLSSFAGAVFDMNESGATLTWKTFFPDQEMPAWLEYVKDRDLWNKVLPGTEEIHEAVSFMGRSFQRMDWLCSLSKDELQSALIPLGERLLEPKRKRVAEIAATARRETVLGEAAMVVEIDPSEARLVSDVCAAIDKTNACFAMAYIWNAAEDGWDLSFRSDKNGLNFDVSEIAKHLGGGGHRNASGAKAKRLDDVFSLT